MRLVQNQDRRAFEHRLGDRDPLTLAAGELQAALADDRVVAVGKLGDELMHVRRAADLDDPVEVRLGRRCPSQMFSATERWSICGSCGT